VRFFTFICIRKVRLLPLGSIMMKILKKIWKSRLKIVLKFRNAWREIELHLGNKGIRINIYHLLSFGRHRFLVDPFEISMDRDKVDHFLRLFDSCLKRTASSIKFVTVDGSNIETYLPVLLDLEHRTYPADYCLDEASFLLRFRDKYFCNPVCFLYFRDDEPVGYTLGTNLEFYDPFEYGYEIGCHPEYLKYTAFYAENISIVPEAQNSMLMVRMIQDIYCTFKEQQYATVLIHAMTGNNTHILLRKIGFVTLLNISNFLNESQEVSYMQLPYLKTIEN
jgi:hypothetical protein